MSPNIGGARFEFTNHEVQKALKVLAWSFGSALVTFLIAYVNAIEVPVGYVWAVPLVNSALYTLKEFIADNR